MLSEQSQIEAMESFTTLCLDIMCCVYTDELLQLYRRAGVFPDRCYDPVNKYLHNSSPVLTHFGDPLFQRIALVVDRLNLKPPIMGRVFRKLRYHPQRSWRLQ